VWVEQGGFLVFDKGAPPVFDGDARLALLAVENPSGQSVPFRWDARVHGDVAARQPSFDWQSWGLDHKYRHWQRESSDNILRGNRLNQRLLACDRFLGCVAVSSRLDQRSTLSTRRNEMGIETAPD